MLLQKSFTQGVKSYKNKGELPQYFVENSHPAIVSQEDFDKVQLIRQERSAKIKRDMDTTIRYELSSKVHCGLCAKSFKRRTNTRIKNKEQQTQWICSTQNSFGIGECRASIISDELLKDIILDCYNTYLDTPKSTPLIEQTKLEIAEIVGKEKATRELFDKGLITYIQFKSQQTVLQAEYDRLDKICTQENGSATYKKQGSKMIEYSQDIVENHVAKITLKGYAITVTFNNNQEIKGRYKYEHRRYVKDTD